MRKKPSISPLAAALVTLCGFGATSMAVPPDLTNGGVPDEDPPITINLGPTGARGWVYHVKTDTSESRQILVTAVDAGSPANGILAADDVILGADGTGANPTAFSADARKSLALAIAEAEARSPANLKLLRWRSGSTATVTLALQTMGVYSATAPYSCPKSTKILRDGLQYVYDNETAGRYSFGAITLLATNSPTYRAKAQTAARALIPSQATMDRMMSDERDANSMVTWQRGHTLIFLAEYYLATGDAEVLPAIEAYAVNIAKNHSLFGTVGHIFAEKNPDGSHNGPMGGVYGPVNTPGLFCFLGVLLAKECGLTNPELDPAIERSSRFFAYYADKGAIPYGEHDPFSQQHENNGKCGLSALAFMLQTNRAAECTFFAKMSTASATEREVGHTGSFFNYVWAPLGAAGGGEQAAAAHFSRISWMLDLNRRWDGKFQYDCLNGEGHNSGSTWYDFRMSTAALLTYALPLRELHITGKGHDPARRLSNADVIEAVAADDYDADSRGNSGLIADLENWSPKVRKEAAEELGTRSIDASELSQITALANNTGASSRSRTGACYALGRIGDSSSAATLAALLTDSDPYVRYMAAESMRYLSTSAKRGQLDTILAAAASTSRPLFPMDEEDPLHFAHGRLAMLLFYGWSAFGPKGVIWGSGISGVDRDLLYPAIRAVAETPVGLCRSTLNKTYENLTHDDVLAVAGALVDSIRKRAPSDKMFSDGVREGGVKTLRKFGIAEGVPACMLYAADEVGGRRNTPLELLGTFGGGVHTVEPDPGSVPFLESYLGDGETAATAQASLDAIDADTNPATLTPFKSILAATADDTTVNLPADATTLRVSAIDHAKGDSIYTWRKLSGPGSVSFNPNGTAAAATNTVQFDGTPGAYQFEVTMSDSRGLTEAYATVAVELVDESGPDVTPPAPSPMTWTAAPAPAGDGPAVYESFDYAAGTDLTGSGGTGFDGDWATSGNNANAGLFVVNTTGLTFTDGSSNALPVAGKSAHRVNATGRSEANRALTADARAALFADGSTMWFSVLYKKTSASRQAGFVIGTDTFDVAAGWQLDTYADGGEGFGFGSSGDLLVTALSYDDSAGPAEVDSTVDTTTVKLTAGKIVWKANGSNDELTLYNVTDLTTEPTTPIATITADLDQSHFDRVSMVGNGNSIAFDEIRLGTTFAAVTGGAGDSETEIAMTATTAADGAGVEYYFTCTAGGGHDSGWQDSPTYADTGLAPGTEYTYTVTARDKSSNQNTTAPSAAASATTAGTKAGETLKVFILAGQSNMEGHGNMNPVETQGTLEYIVANDPGTYGHLKDGGSWAIRDDVWISYKRGGTTLLTGDISAGYGARSDTIGPELQFGHVMGDAYGEQVLLIKTAWGGKSLAVDFRPPSSGWSVNPPVAAGDQGYYYQEMMTSVSNALANLSAHFPDYNTTNGYVIAGFGWHQGWNDRVNQGHNDEYESNMTNFINDVRSDLGVPDLPFVIATTGMSGWDETHPRALSLMAAQLAMTNFTKYPAFEGNVAVVDTRDFWRDSAVSPANQSYHWNRNAETYCLIGQSMAVEMQTLVSGDDVTPPTPNPATFAAAPAADSDTAVSMTATTGNDASGPVEYLFTETSGNAGGTGSGWQTSASYADTGLTPDTTYTYTVTMRDSLGNTGAASTPADATTTTTGGPSGPVAVIGITGHDGGNWPDTLGHLTDMVNALDPTLIPTGDTETGMDTSADPTDPATWTYAGSAWRLEWKANSRLDPGTSANAKIGWVVLDLGSTTADLESLYLWNVRFQSDTENVATYNVYYANSPTAALPAMPNSKSTTGDYDFSGGGWTLLNTGGALSLPINGSNNSTPQGVVALGGISARHIGLEILTAGGTANRVGLAQVEITAGASLDSDGDGVSDEDELLADTDPDDPNDYFRVLEIGREPNMEVRFTSSSNRVYTLLYCTSLFESVWTPVDSQRDVRGAGAETLLIDSNSAPWMFYKIEVKRP